MQEKRVWNRLRDEELIEILKSMEASKLHPVKAQKIYEKLKDKYDAKDLPSAHTVDRSLRRLLGQPEKLDEITDKDGIGRIDKGQYYLGFQKKGIYITGYWYEQKMGEELESSKYLARFLSDAVIYSKVLNPEYKPDYYLSLQELFGVGQVKRLNEFTEGIIELKPYSAEGGIDVMENVLIIQEAIDTQKKIEFKLGVYRYTSDGMIELDMESKGIQCVSPLQIIMSNGRYYVIVKNERKFQTQEFLFYRIDLMDEIEIIETKRKDAPRKYEWKNSQKFLIANPFFYSGKKEDIVIVDSPVGMPGRAIRNRFLEEKESRRESIKKCYQCIATCNPANTPYCITRALVHAAKGETDDALLFCGENAWRCEKMEHVADIMAEFA